MSVIAEKLKEERGKIAMYLLENESELAFFSIEKCPEIVNVADPFGNTLLHIAARAGNEKIFFQLVGLGSVINLQSTRSHHVLKYSSLNGTPKMVAFAIQSGLDVNHDRTVFSAIRNEKGHAKEILQMMIDHGLELNRVFAMFGDRNNAKTALDYAGGETTDIGKFLRSQGAKTATEVMAENPNVKIISEGSKP